MELMQNRRVTQLRSVSRHDLIRLKFGNQPLRQCTGQSGRAMMLNSDSELLTSGKQNCAEMLPLLKKKTISDG